VFNWSLIATSIFIVTGAWHSAVGRSRIDHAPQPAGDVIVIPLGISR
jgi:uncharacterized RmlC-like cupin family protein